MNTVQRLHRLNTNSLLVKRAGSCNLVDGDGVQVNQNDTDCPRCQLEVDAERMQQMPAVCNHCGFVLSVAEMNLRASAEKSMLFSVLLASGGILLAIVYLGSWGSYTLESIPLKIEQFTHTLSPAGMERLAQIGLDLHKYDLVESMFTELARKSDPANYLRLGKFQMSRGEYDGAVATYREYFKLGKNDLDARYDFARSLGEVGQIDEAVRNFDFVLASKPGVRQVTVLHKYVNLLVKANRLDQARALIESVRRQDPLAKQFMDTEYKVITERMRSRG